jgi:uncharacterized protein YdiU (UPF0061 family)
LKGVEFVPRDSSEAASTPGMSLHPYVGYQNPPAWKSDAEAAAYALMRTVNPVVIPRNHRVEEALSAAVERADYTPFETLLKILARPFDDQPEFAAFAEPAPEGQGCYRTFCGT